MSSSKPVIPQIEIMVKLDEKIWEGIKVQEYFLIVKKAKVGKRILGGTGSMGWIESMDKVLMKIWEGKRENRDLPNKNQGFSSSSRE